MSLPAVQELRALDVFDRIPAGFETAVVDDGYNWPHLRPGEAAVFDPGQRTPIHGELFVFQYSSNGRRSIASTECRLTKGIRQPDGSIGSEHLWWTCPLNRPRGGETIDDWLRQRRQLYMSDGPASIEVIGHHIIGRVVGVYLGRAAA